MQKILSASVAFSIHLVLGIGDLASTGTETAVEANGCSSRPAGSSMLMQFAMKPTRTTVDKPEEDDKSDKKDQASSGSLKDILKTAMRNSNRSGMPFEYALDVDFLHDANNPLDNGGAKDKTNSPEEKESDADAEDESKPSDSGKEENSDSKGEDKDKDKDKDKGKGNDKDNDKDKDKEKDKDNDKGKSDGDEKSKDYATKDGKVISVPGCATRADSRVETNSFTSAAKAGSHCLFGVDDRDEGSHCILSDGSYGTNGWCWTSKDRTTWGSCNEYCPLWGAAGVLEKRIDKMNVAVVKTLKKIRKKKDCGESKENSMLEKSSVVKPTKEDDDMIRLEEELFKTSAPEA